MNISFKFFAWKVGFKLKRLDTDKRISFLANKLTQEIINGGYDIRGLGEKGTIPDFLTYSVYIFKRGNKASIHVDNINRGQSIKGEYTGTWPEGDPNA